MKRLWALPLLPLYAAGWAVRWLGTKPKRLAWPVVSVGSLSAGGAGKTPFVIALARLMKRGGIYVDVLSRGYGRSNQGPAWVRAEGSADSYGDEPLLITREAEVMVYVAPRRYHAGILAESLGSQKAVHLLDDGFQHRQLARDVDVVLVSSGDLEDWLLPVGNRREPLRALRRADVLAVVVGDGAVVRHLRAMGLRQPVWWYRREMVVPEVGGPVVAFCGIARPEQFFAGLERAGLTVVARRAFADHHRFTDREVAELGSLAKESGARALVTTAKDSVRIGEVRMGELAAGLGVPVLVADLRIDIEGEAIVLGWLRERLGW